MKVGVTTYGCDGGKSGISRYVIELIRAMASQLDGDTLEVLTLPAEKGIFVSPDLEIDEVCPPGVVTSPPRNILWHLTKLPATVRDRGYDILFCPAANRRLPWKVRCPVVGTIHDFSWLHMAGKYDRFRTFYLTRMLPRLMSRMDFALTVSESSRKDILANTSLPPERVRVTPIAADTRVYRADVAGTEEAAARYGIGTPYILYISRLEHPGKNHQALIRAFEILCADHAFEGQLVLVGGDFLGAEVVHRLVEQSPFRDRIVLPGFVATEDLPPLLAGARVFAFPSLYEGFGIPVLEAMASGVPTVVSNCSSLPEVGGDAVSYFDPSDAKALADRLSELLADDNLRKNRIEAGLARANTFSWERTARETWEVLHQVVEQ